MRGAAPLCEGFISYAHEDHETLIELQKHLKPIERGFGIKFWADKRIVAGDYWRTEIAEAILRAEVHVLIVTPAFFDSDFIWEHELPAIHKKYEAGDLVLPVIAKRCMWENFLGPLQAVPSENGRLRPVIEWRPRTNGFDAVRQQSVPALEAHLGRAPKTPLKWKRP
jgi:hypothetical protein